MQRLFSMFPRGAPGVGLLLLRLGAVAGVFVHDAVWSGMSASPLLAVPLSVGGAALSLGAVTPFAALATGTTVLLLFATQPAGAASTAYVALLLATAVALALLGPGAWSLDARWFGRRLITLDSRVAVGDAKQASLAVMARRRPPDHDGDGSG